MIEDVMLTIDELKPDIESTRASVDTVKQLVEQVKTLTNTIQNSNVIRYGSVIKSIQRGYGSLHTGSTTHTISAVNVSKSIVLFSNTSNHRDAYHGNTDGAMVTYLSSTGISIKVAYELNYIASQYYWQVVEFY